MYELHGTVCSSQVPLRDEETNTELKVHSTQKCMRISKSK